MVSSIFSYSKPAGARAPCMTSTSASASRRMTCRGRLPSSLNGSLLGLKSSSSNNNVSFSRSRRSNAVVRAEFDPDNASILVAGGGGVALEVTKRLKDLGAWVWQLQRTDVRRKEIEGMMAIVVNGDAMKPEDIENAFDAMDEADAVVTSLGGSPSDPLVDSVGNLNLIEAALKRGVKKFILITSIGTGDSKDATPPNVYETLKPVLLEKAKAEERLQAVGDKMQWVIIRPGGLKSDTPTGNGVLTEDKKICGSITRGDVADLVVKALRSDKSNGKILSAVDKDEVFGDATFDTFEL